jgi:S-DNA-T family DNA segregation ATPase FtsK/SpoIIIE
MLANEQIADERALLPATLEAKLSRAAGRVAGYVLLALVAAAWASLFTATLADPSFSRVTGGDARNLLGTPGAAVSDLLLQTLGFAAVLVLLAPMFWGLELVLSGRVDKFRVKAAFFPLSVLVLAGAFSALPTTPGWPLRNGFGGILGDVVYSFASGLGGLVSTSGAATASGLLLFAGGFAALAYSIGMALSDLAISLRKTEPIDIRETAHALHEGLSSATQSLRERMPSFAAPRAAVEDAGERWMKPRREPELAAPPRAAPPTRGDDDSDATIGMRSKREDDEFYDAIEDDDEPDTADASRIARKFAPAVTADADLPVDDEPRAARRAAADDWLPMPMPVPQPAAVARSVRHAEPSYKRFSLNLLKRAQAAKPGADVSQVALRGSAQLLEETLGDFGVKGEIRDIKPGPVVTLFELEPSRGTKSSRVIGLADDIARSMSATSVRVAVVPGRNAIGIELPNARRDKVLLRELLESDQFRSSDGPLPMVLGKSIEGEPVVADLAHMPHVLVAGTTGSGKSVGLNAMVLSLLYKNAPDDCRFIMIDPKMLELSVYNGIPHLLCPVVTEPHKAVAALNWVVAEMEERYKRMAKLSVRRIDVFNNRVRNARKRGEAIARTVQTGFDRAGKAIYESQPLDLEPMPYIVVVIDEFADLMAVAGKEVEFAVQRLAQKARAAGIHLIMATQRPSVDVITGTIKANFPTRISFKVASKIDSRTILNEQGAEQLLGQGDMLYGSGSGQTMRVHGPFVSDEEIEGIAQALREQGAPRYVDGITEHGLDDEDEEATEAADTSDDLYDRAVAIVMRDHKASTSYLQRRLSIGYNRAADLIERMEQDGLISAANGTGKREIIAEAGERRAGLH